MNDDPLSNFITILQDKTSQLDSNAREMQDYIQLFESLKMKLNDSNRTDLEADLLVNLQKVTKVSTTFAATLEKFQVILNYLQPIPHTR